MKKYTLKFLFISLVALQVLVAQNTDTIANKPHSIPFLLTKHNNISIKATLNKMDTVHLMFHTAEASITLIEEAAKKIQSIHWNEKYEVESWGGKSRARYSKHNSLQIGEFIWDNLSIWENKNSGPETDGKFGPNLFKGKILEIDFESSLIKIHSTIPKNIEDYEKLELISENGLMFIEAESIIGKKSYKNRFLIHTGYGGTILYDDKFVGKSKIGNKVKLIEESELKDSYGNVLKTKKAILPLFIMGKTEFKNVPIGFFEGGINRQKRSVLGGELLKRFHIIIDSERKHIYLKGNQLMSLGFNN